MSEPTPNVVAMLATLAGVDSEERAEAFVANLRTWVAEQNARLAGSGASVR